MLVAIYWVDGVGTSGTVLRGTCGDAMLLVDIDCQVMNANTTKAMPINAVRVVIKVFTLPLEFTSA